METYRTHRCRNAIVLLALLGLVPAGFAAEETKPRLTIGEKGHTERVTCVAFDPDGKILASGSADRTVRLWDAATGREVGILRGHKGSVSSLAFSPNGKLLVSTGDDKTVRVWDVTAAKEKFSAKTGKDGGVLAAVFSPDSKLLAWSDGMVHVWDMAGEKEKTILGKEGDQVHCLGFRPDGKLLTFGKETLRVWDVANGKQEVVFHGVLGKAIPVFSPDGKLLANVNDWFDDDIHVRVWDVSAGKEMGTYTIRDGVSGPGWKVNQIAFRPDCKLMALAYDFNVVLVDVTGKEPEYSGSIGGGHFFSRAIVFSPNGKSLAVTRNEERVVYIWDVPDTRNPSK